MSENLLMVSDQNFSETLANAKQPFLLDFWAPWCGPCKAIGPVIEELARDYEGKFLFGKLNVDDNPEISGKYGIRSIPTLVFFNDGQVLDKKVGAVRKGDLVNTIEKILAGEKIDAPLKMAYPAMEE